MLVLIETWAGFALFKVLDEGKLSEIENLSQDFTTPNAARKVVELKAFLKYENTMRTFNKDLQKFLRINCNGETVGVADSDFANTIKHKLKNIVFIHNNAVMELTRCVKSQLTELLPSMSLELSHSLSGKNLDKYKHTINADKGETIIIQIIALLDLYDKTLNTYAMSVQDWYGWHFPELSNIVQDNLLYAKVVKKIGNRSNVGKLDFSEILGKEVEAELKATSVISRGTEVCDLFLINIEKLCDYMLTLVEDRNKIHGYLRAEMNKAAPNLTFLVGEVVGARLIAECGSLINLAKLPGSAIQMLGAKKAFLGAPKYGLICHANLVAQATTSKHKKKLARSLAAKIALAVRCDLMGDSRDNSMRLKMRAELEGKSLPNKGSEAVERSNEGNGSAMKELKRKRKKNNAFEEEEAAAAPPAGGEEKEKKHLKENKERKREKKKNKAFEEDAVAAAPAGGEEKHFEVIQNRKRERERKRSILEKNKKKRKH